MIIFGVKFWAWGSALTQNIWNCSNCGYQGQFIEKKGMKFLTFYWVVPTIPVSGITNLVQCPKCKARYQSNTPSNLGQPPLSNPWS